MDDITDLRRELHRIDGRGYGAYKDIRGAWRFPDFVLHVDWVQGDPYAAPSRVRVRLDPAAVGLPARLWRSRARAVGTAAFLARAFDREARAARRKVGSGRGGELRIEAPGQEVMAQTAVLVSDDGSVEARFRVGLPARGRRILGPAAAEILLETVPRIVSRTLVASAHDPDALEEHAAAGEDGAHLRGLLEELGAVAFVADGALLPRRSGVDDRPLEDGVRFASPESLRREVELPNAGRVSGMIVPTGVTLIVGGGFHGKSTLLSALATGIHGHRPGDGRERVATVPDAVRIRAEDGRSVAGVDISPFIDGLPLGTDTRSFTTPNASGSTSQAAAIVEAVESGATALLIDEDTSATNFMIRDRRMQELVPKEREPITPFVDRVRELYETLGISSVLVLGGSGDYLDVADTVIAMDAYRPVDVGDAARRVAEEHPTGRRVEGGGPIEPPAPRRPVPGSIDPRHRRHAVHVKVRSRDRLGFGSEDLDLGAVAPLVSEAQVRAIGRALALVAREADGDASVAELLDRVEEAVASGGLDALDPRRPGDLAAFRRHDLAGALNRLRSLEIP